MTDVKALREAAEKATPAKIWIDRIHGQHPDDWTWTPDDTARSLFTARQLEREKIAYVPAARLTELEAEVARVKKLLREHHDHHLAVGEIGLKDGDGGWIEIDNGSEYSDSGLFERTEAALADVPTEWKPAPRGGITADWWQASVLERRKRKATEAERDTLAQQVKGLAEDAEQKADKIEGLEADLDSAVEVAFKRGAEEWVRLNYPKHYERLAAVKADKERG
jgi:hypothetical protein